MQTQPGVLQRGKGPGHSRESQEIVLLLHFIVNLLPSHLQKLYFGFYLYHFTKTKLGKLWPVFISSFIGTQSCQFTLP